MLIWNCLELNKTIGNKNIFRNLSLNINKDVKVAIIGRNGLGKSTLLKIIAGEDKEFLGQVFKDQSTNIVLTKQEHNIDKSKTALDYILDSIPFYRELKQIITAYEKDANSVKLEDYCDAIDKFYAYDFYNIEDKIVNSLKDFQISEEISLNPLVSLSGGQKRFIELVRIMYSNADLALIDEPTNHMDYIGKEKFISWLKNTKQTVIIVSHDRDVLRYVQQIWEIKDQSIAIFNGNYDDYLKQNSHSTITAIYDYEIKKKELRHLKQQITRAKIQKGRTSSQAPKILQTRLEKQYTKIADNLEKPSFWIDKESLQNVDEKIIESYDKYKEKNIKIISDDTTNHRKLLVDVQKISLGYNSKLFEKLTFELYYGDKIFIKGRNGAGKTTLVKALINTVYQKELTSKLYEGNIKINSGVKLGTYEQEINLDFLDITLEKAIQKIYSSQKLEIDDEGINKILSNYLFNVRIDKHLLVEQLSGGQKARLQLIKMLSNQPNLLILDEPTNHLDLPSIEVLENNLQNFNGAIIYITHDTYLQNALKGDVIEI